MKKIIRILKFLLPAIILLTACNNVKKNNVIKIGLIADLTGPMALYGNWVKNGVDIAKDSINNKTLKVDLITEDSKSEPKAAVNAINKLISTKVKYIITGNGSSAIMSMSPIANKNQNILFVALASSPTISGAGEYIFRNRVSGLYEAKSLVDFSLKKDFKNFGTIALNNESGKPYMNAFENQLEKNNSKLLLDELVDPKQTDLSSQALKFKNSNVVTIFIVLQADQAVNFINQCIEINYYPTWLGVSSLKSDKILQLPEKVKNNFYIASEDINILNPKYQPFNNIYKRKFEENAGIYSVNGYDALNLLYKLIKENNGDVEKVKNALHKINYTGAGGQMTFDKNGDARRNIQIFRIEDNSFVEVGK